jgi:hypothetical protein
MTVAQGVTGGAVADADLLLRTEREDSHSHRSRSGPSVHDPPGARSRNLQSNIEPLPHFAGRGFCFDGVVLSLGKACDGIGAAVDQV